MTNKQLEAVEPAEFESWVMTTSRSCNRIPPIRKALFYCFKRWRQEKELSGNLLIKCWQDEQEIRRLRLEVNRLNQEFTKSEDLLLRIRIAARNYIAQLERAIGPEKLAELDNPSNKAK